MESIVAMEVAAAEKELPKRGKLRMKISVQIVLHCSLLRVDTLTTHREGPSSFSGQILSPLHQREVLRPDGLMTRVHPLTIENTIFFCS